LAQLNPQFKQVQTQKQIFEFTLILPGILFV
jgi:hypothetical protein